LLLYWLAIGNIGAVLVSCWKALLVTQRIYRFNLTVFLPDHQVSRLLQILWEVLQIFIHLKDAKTYREIQ
jgi:hypothetical protein